MVLPWVVTVWNLISHHCVLRGLLYVHFNRVLTANILSQGMRYSLQSRELIADSIETVTCAQRHDANISIPGCDKNMPGVIMVCSSLPICLGFGSLLISCLPST